MHKAFAAKDLAFQGGSFCRRIIIECVEKVASKLKQRLAPQIGAAQWSFLGHF